MALTNPNEDSANTAWVAMADKLSHSLRSVSLARRRLTSNVRLKNE